MYFLQIMRFPSTYGIKKSASKILLLANKTLTLNNIPLFYFKILDIDLYLFDVTVL